MDVSKDNSIVMKRHIGVTGEGQKKEEQLPSGNDEPKQVENGDVRNDGDGESQTWFGLLPTKTRNEVPLIFREPHINTGFRQPYQPWYYYLLSVFQIHNESVNVLTHLIACLLMFQKVQKFTEAGYDLIGDPYMWPLIAGFIAGFLLYGCSSFAHCFQSKSEYYHYFCFMVDYSAIGVYGFGCALLHFHYSADEEFYYAAKSFFIPVATFMGFFTCFGNMHGKLTYTRPYPFTRKLWQIGSVAAMYAWLILPIVHRFFDCRFYQDERHCDRSINAHLRQVFFFLTSGIFYASDIPQKFFPGCFDIVGHSHQIFHVFIALCSLSKLDAIFLDIQDNYQYIIKRPQPTFLSSFSSLIIIISLEIAWVLYNKQKIMKKAAKEV
ncbi:membrane progestin receptor beta-like [Lineus longissimus]|uniref:membrane progestin receptor beta-like n=1 Tax=Lineus longissimus TaxID=88925 RepID=UPI002B4F14D4